MKKGCHEKKSSGTHYIFVFLFLALGFSSAVRSADVVGDEDEEIEVASRFSSVYIFGDSLSDTGNLASVVGAFPFPYYMNRVSNGPVGVDVMASALGLDAEASLHLIGPENGTNYAVVDADAAGDDAIDLTAQVISFQTNHNFTAPSDALYVLFIGGNDVRNARDADEGHQAQSMLHEALQGVREAVISLTQSGARTFLLINAPDIGAIPETRLMADSCGDDRVISRAHSLSQQYRAGLHHLARSLRFQMGRDIEIIEFDLFGYFRNLLDQADRLGLVYTREACFSQQTQRFHPACQNGENADQFVFFDEIHPTALVHERVGKALARIVLRQSALRYGAPRHGEQRHGEQRRYAQCGLRFDHDFSYGNRLFRHNIWHSIRY